MEQDKLWDYLQNDGVEHGKFSQARERFMVRHLLSGQSVLNIGVGSGRLERMAREKGVDVYALDPSERAIDRLRGELKIGEKAQAGYSQDIPFPTETFDVVVMSEVLEHLDDDVLKRSLKEVYRVLKPQGYLLASTPYKEDLGESRVICPNCESKFHRMGHVQSFDLNRMKELLESNRFLVSKAYITTFVDWRRKGIGNMAKSIVRMVLARLGKTIADPHIVVTAERPKET